ncbi:hypothetical protein CPB83DRAFT_861558 [Crepidotus variabilis]|uniref:F-box domain-containing protein n=1 Tax=Crepidotus variabilis TaxID=179855 RepID=A0A9P6E8E7_9AGAR|nr:hypothetical protein CPB83DRAFT_861558 [Crepidotus variabilis]
MSRQAFRDGIRCYKEAKYQEAIKCFDKAVAAGSQNHYLMYDSRAAAYLKLGQRKEALKDAKAAIDNSPNRWQGYARAARVFVQFNKPDAAQTMVSMAMERLKETEEDRRASLMELEAEIRQLKEKLRLGALDNMAKLPIELFAEITKMLVEDDHTILVSLIHVSKNWRSVIQSIPVLWSKLVLTQRRPKPKAKMWIEHSDGRLGELIIKEACANSPRWPGDSLEGLDWEKLRSCRVQHWDVLSYLQTIGLDSSITSFHCLHFDYDNNENSFSTATQIRLFDQTNPFVNLDQFSVSGGILDVEQCTTQINNLRACSLRNCYLQQGVWGRFLAANPVLESLTLDRVYPPARVSTEFVLELNQLKSLFLGGAVPLDIFTAKMPQLQTLDVRVCWREEVNLLIRHLVATKAGGLTELRVHCCQLDDVVPFIALLRNSPNLQTLEVSNISAGITSLIEFLSAHHPSSSRHPILLRDPQMPPQEVLCPKLNHINFSGCPEVQTGPLVRLIKSRLPPPSTPSNDLTKTPPTSASATPSSVSDTDTPQPSISRIETLIIDRCPNIDGEWLPRIRSAVPFVSSVYMNRKTKYRGA